MASKEPVAKVFKAISSISVTNTFANGILQTSGCLCKYIIGFAVVLMLTV